MRRELGDAARVLVRSRLYQRLGFVRLSDYARERLGVSARMVQAAAWLATRLETLPAVSRAYDRSELAWTQARVICGVASAGDEERWLAIARRSTVEELERVAHVVRPPRGVEPDPDMDTSELDGEPRVRWRLACPSRVRALCRRALDLAACMAGGPVAVWRAMDLVAAEGISGRPTGMPPGERAFLELIRLARRRGRRSTVTEDVNTTSPGAAASNALTATDVAATSGATALERGAPVDTPFATDPPSDAFALDARLVEAIRVIRTSEPRIGRLLRVVVDHRLHRMLGYTTLEDYVRERLGLSIRKVWALLKVEKATPRSDEFSRAYRDGRLSWVRALTLLPVLERETATAWVTRAEAVTVRRLADEVNWVLAARDAFGPHVSLGPPPLASRLVTPVPSRRRESSIAADLQIGAGRAASQVCDAEVTFFGPASVVTLLRDVLDAFAIPGTPRWTAFERLLLHVIQYWESVPRHRDPIFDRDGWRCTVPACSSRRNLHDHHIRFRSRGGGNGRDNRTVVCAAHHLHGLHGGTVRASGTAPDGIEWRLGVRGDTALLVFRGDRLLLTARDDHPDRHAGLVAHEVESVGT